MVATVASPEGLPGVGGSISKMASLQSQLIWAGCWQEALVPHHGDLFANSECCLIVLMTWQLASPRTSALREQTGSCNVFFDLISKVTLSCLQNPIGFTSRPYPVWERMTQGHKCQEVRIPGALSEAGYTCINSFSPCHVPREV